LKTFVRDICYEGSLCKLFSYREKNIKKFNFFFCKLKLRKCKLKVIFKKQYKKYVQVNPYIN